MLADGNWRRKYTPDDGDLVRLFYVPALEDAERYDRLTGYFNAGALALAARGIEGLVRNGGHMRLVVGCTLPPAEIEAIERGAKLRELVERRLADVPLAPPDQGAADALELLAWMVARGHLDVKVAVPCDAGRRPVPEDGIFHEKAGIVTDRAGDQLAWNGSLNETAAGWRRNWESINVYTSWGPEPKRVADEEANFARLWANRAKRVIVLDTPEAVRRDLLRFLPERDRPVRLRQSEKEPTPPSPVRPGGPSPDAGDSPADDAAPPPVDLRRRVWTFIGRAPALPDGGARVGEATAAVVPWPHQVRAFERLYSHWPPRLLIADEVGLGKTIQAGLLLRQAWLAGRAKRILILAPKAVLRQWQIELREKFNLNWPIYDGRQLVWHASPARRGRERRLVDADAWHAEPVVIASSHLLRRRGRAKVLLEEAAPWDLVVLDEAHHARRRAAGSPQEGGPNALLRLMQGLKDRAAGLLLLTATPMQVHPIEVWDLLHLLGLPADWTASAFLQFFEDVGHASPSGEAVERMARLFRAAERRFGEMAAPDARRITGLSALRTNRVLRALRDRASIPRRQLETAERRAALAVMRSHTPVRHLVSRHTRALLRRYHQEGLLATPIADRRVEDRLVEMTAGERALYDAVEDYIATTYNQAAAEERTAVGFVMTIYRRRLASSFHALRATLLRRLDAATSAGDVPPGEAMPGTEAGDLSSARFTVLDEDVSDDETSEEARDADEVARLEQRALAVEEAADVRALLDGIALLPPDSKLRELKQAIRELRRDGFAQAMVFTQYTDTMDFLREALSREREAPSREHAVVEGEDAVAEAAEDHERRTDASGGGVPAVSRTADRRQGALRHGERERPHVVPDAARTADRREGALRLMCFSGRGGEIRSAGGEWSAIGRDEVKRRFREGEADLLLCTDAAAEGLNFQFCGALINYDMPWNPMRVEQRIGRIDRLGQAHPAIRIVNLHYEGTVETDVYRALRTRINLFEAVVGPLQPILARLPRTIAGAVLSRSGQPGESAGRAAAERASAPAQSSLSDAGGHADVVEAIERQVREARAGGFDIDATVDTEVAMPARAPSPVSMEDLDRVVASPDLMPPGTDVQPLGRREYGLLAPGMAERLRVTTDPGYYEEHAESVELWSPGNPLFTSPEFVAEAKDDDFPEATTLRALLEGAGGRRDR